MSHATVAVIIKDTISDIIKKKLKDKNITKYSEMSSEFTGKILEEAVYEALKPFDENIEVPKYIKLTKEDIIKLEKNKMLEKANDKEKYINAPEDDKPKWNPKYINYLLNNFNKDYEIFKNKSNEDLYEEYIANYSPEDISPDGGIYSTYNPLSKWDWYVIGGRWNNEMYTCKKKSDGTSVDTNVCQIKDLNFEPIYLENNKITKGKFKTYAILDSKGKWHEAGQLLYWGISAATEEDKTKFDNEYESIIKNEDPNDWIILVDYHI